MKCYILCAMNYTDSGPRTPGQLIKELLEQRGWSIRVLGVVLGVSEQVAYRLVSDNRTVDAETAVALEEVFAVPAERFLELQRGYELAKVRIKARPDPGRNTRAHLHSGLPVPEMIKRGWLEAPDVRDTQAVEAALAKFFNVESPDEIEILPHAAKKTPTGPEVTPVRLAWLYRVKTIASDMLVPRYSEKAARAAIPKLSALLGAREEARHAPRILAEAGIRFTIVESLSTAKIDGACLWLDDQAPVIAMSFRYDRIDNFWFVLRHELEHVLRFHGQDALMVDAELEGDRAGTGPDITEDERVANAAAAEFCVPHDQLQRFIDRKSPFFPERDIVGFARTLQLHPGLIAGQLQHNTGRYDRFRKHLVKIWSVVAPNATVDGWGDVAPVAI